MRMFDIDYIFRCKEEAVERDGRESSETEIPGHESQERIGTSQETGTNLQLTRKAVSKCVHKKVFFVLPIILGFIRYPVHIVGSIILPFIFPYIFLASSLIVKCTDFKASNKHWL